MRSAGLCPADRMILYANTFYLNEKLKLNITSPGLSILLIVLPYPVPDNFSICS